MIVSDDEVSAIKKIVITSFVLAIVYIYWHDMDIRIA